MSGIKPMTTNIRLVWSVTEATEAKSQTQQQPNFTTGLNSCMHIGTINQHVTQGMCPYEINQKLNIFPK